MKYFRNNKGIIFVFLISLLPLFNLLTPGLPVAHDTFEHVARIASFNISLSEGILIPRWGGNLNWGYGHPILMFLYPIPSYLASFFHLIGFSYIDSLKLLFATAYIFSGIFFYAWIKKFLGEKSSIVGAVLYLYAPYRFVDLYVRGAIGEHVAFMFMPLVLITIYSLFKSNLKNIKNIFIHVVFVAATTAGLILSHNAISLIFFPFILFYVLFLYYETQSKQKIILSFFSIAYGFLISAFFWIPAFMEGKYTLRDILTENIYSERFVDIKAFIYSSWGYGGTGDFTLQIGIIHIALVIISILFFIKFFKKTDKERILFLGTLIFLIASIFLMTSYSNFLWEKLTILQKLQFPWRFLSMVVFSTALIGSLYIFKTSEKYQKYLIAIIIAIAIIPTFNYWKAHSYQKYEDIYFERDFPSTTDTGESSPIWSIRFMEDYPKTNIEIIEGKGDIKTILRSSTKHEYIINNSERIRIRENTLYFPGWKIYNNNQIIENVEFQDPKNRGIMTFHLDPGMHNIILKFEDTKIRFYSNLISLISISSVIILSVIFLIFSFIKSKKNK